MPASLRTSLPCYQETRKSNFFIRSCFKSLFSKEKECNTLKTFCSRTENQCHFKQSSNIYWAPTQWHKRCYNPEDTWNLPLQNSERSKGDTEVNSNCDLWTELNKKHPALFQGSRRTQWGDSIALNVKQWERLPSTNKVRKISRQEKMCTQRKHWGMKDCEHWRHMQTTNLKDTIHAKHQIGCLVQVQALECQLPFSSPSQTQSKWSGIGKIGVLWIFYTLGTLFKKKYTKLCSGSWKGLMQVKDAKA